MENYLSDLKSEINRLEAQRDSGELSADDYQAQRADLAQRWLDRALQVADPEVAASMPGQAEVPVPEAAPVPELPIRMLSEEAAQVGAAPAPTAA